MANATQAEILFGLAADQSDAPPPVVLPGYPNCPHCSRPVVEWKGGADRRCLAVTERGLEWMHALCRQQVMGSTDEPMATERIARDMPLCVRCGLDYWSGHLHRIGSLWAAWCDDGEPYQPATPFASRSWPYQLIAGFDHATEEVLYADGTRERHTCPDDCPCRTAPESPFEYGDADLGAIAPMVKQAKRKAAAA